MKKFVKNIKIPLSICKGKDIFVTTNLFSANSFFFMAIFEKVPKRQINDDDCIMSSSLFLKTYVVVTP